LCHDLIKLQDTFEGIFIPLFSHSRQGHENGSVYPSASAGLNGKPKMQV